MSVQKQDHPSIKVAVTGVSGTGKTTLWEKLIRREKAKWIFLYDHKEGDLARRFGVRPCYTEDEILAATVRGGLVIYNPSRDWPGKRDQGFLYFSELVYAMCRKLKGKKIFGTDELDALVDNRCEPDTLCEMLDEGRTFQIDCFFIAQSMNGIHNQVRKQITEIFAMRQGDENGCKYLIEKGFIEEELMSLKNGLWIYKNLNTGELVKGGKSFEPKNANRNLQGL